MPPRRKTTTSVRWVVDGARSATRVVAIWLARLATPTAPAPASTRRRVNPLRHWSRCACRSAATASACTRIAASGRLGPKRASSVRDSPLSIVMASPQRVVDGVEQQRSQALDLAAQAGVADGGALLGAEEGEQRLAVRRRHLLEHQAGGQVVEVGPGGGRSLADQTFDL